MAGGDNGVGLKSTEILNVSSMIWTDGPDLIKPVKLTTMVPGVQQQSSPAAFLVGGSEDRTGATSSIYMQFHETLHHGD